MTQNHRATSFEGLELGVGCRSALLKNSMGISSIVWGYLAPLVVLLTTLFGAYFCNMAEGAAAAASLIAVAVYYAVLYLLRRRFEKSIQFTIVKEQ